MKEMYFYLDCLPFYFKGYTYGGFDINNYSYIEEKIKEYEKNVR